MNCAWIGAEHPSPVGKFAYFRLDAELPKGCELTARITAAAREPFEAYLKRNPPKERGPQQTEPAVRTDVTDCP